MDPIEKMKKWHGAKTQNLALIVDALKEYEIDHVEVRVNNFLDQLGADIDKAAIDKLKSGE
jgi:hypothetical protein